MNSYYDPLKSTWLNESPGGQLSDSRPDMTQRIGETDIKQPRPNVLIFEDFKLMFGSTQVLYPIKQCKGE